MKVRELIDILSGFDPDCDVEVLTCHDEWIDCEEHCVEQLEDGRVRLGTDEPY